MSEPPRRPNDGRSAKHSQQAVWTWLILGAALIVHLGVVFSVAQQPLGIHDGPEERRNVVWSLHRDMTVTDGPAGDFFAVYAAGEPDTPPPYGYSYRYLPIVGQTLGKIAATMPPRAAWWSWILVLECLLAALVFSWWRRVPDWRLRCFGSAALLLSSPYWLEIHMGQFTFATVTIVALGLLYTEVPPAMGSLPHGKRRTRVSAGTLCAAALLKVFPLIVLPAWIRQKPSAVSTAIAVSTVVLLSVPAFALDPQSWLTFYEANFSAPTGGMTTGNFGVVYLIHEVAFEFGVDWISTRWQDFATGFRIAVLMVSVGVVLLARRRSLLLGSTLMLLAHFVSYFHVWEHHMSGVVVIGLLLLLTLIRPNQDNRGSEELRAHPLALVAVIGALLALVLPTPFVVLDAAHDWDFPRRLALVSSKALPTLTLYLVAAWTLINRGFARPRPWFGVPDEKLTGVSPPPESFDDTPKKKRKLDARRAALFAFMTCGIVLGSINGLIAHLEITGELKTLTPTEGIQFVDRPLFRLEGKEFVTTTYGEMSLSKQRFDSDFEGWRAILLGGSFMMGDPYMKPGFVPDDSKSEGAIESWLRAGLETATGGEPWEVLNFAAPAQNSQRVKEIAKLALKHQPDLLIVGTGNNEGAMTPRGLNIALRRFAGFRLLWRVLQSRADADGDLPFYVPQVGQPEELLVQFEENLQAIVEAAGKTQTPVLLCRMPLNLRSEWDTETYDITQPPAPLNIATEPIWAELIRPLPPGELEQEATSQLQAQAGGIADGDQGTYWTVRGIRELRLGQSADGREHLGRFNEPCAAQGIEHWLAGRTDAAIESFSDCTTIGRHSALHWLGGTLSERGEFDAARRAWTSEVEFNPTGRTRPSYNAVAAKLAAQEPHVFLADLHEKAMRVSPNQIPGSELYIDACHMNWNGYSHMAEALLEAIFEHGLGPEGAHFDPSALPDRDSLAESWGLPPLEELLASP